MNITNLFYALVLPVIDIFHHQINPGVMEIRFPSGTTSHARLPINRYEFCAGTFKVFVHLAVAGKFFCGIDKMTCNAIGFLLALSRTT